MKIKKLSFEMVFLTLTLCFLCEDSWGYINPSSGYILWQALFGVLVGAMFFAKRIWFFCRGIFMKEKSSDSTNP